MRAAVYRPKRTSCLDSLVHCSDSILITTKYHQLFPLVYEIDTHLTRKSVHSGCHRPAEAEVWKFKSMKRLVRNKGGPN